MAQLIGHSPNMEEVLGLISAQNKLGMVAHACFSSTWGVGIGRWKLQGHPQVHSKQSETHESLSLEKDKTNKSKKKKKPSSLIWVTDQVKHI